MKRDNVIPFRASDDEQALLKRLADRDGLTVSSWIRAQIHKEARRCGLEKGEGEK